MGEGEIEITETHKNQDNSHSEIKEEQTLPDQIIENYGSIFKKIKINENDIVVAEISNLQRTPISRFFIFEHGAVEVLSPYMRTLFNIDYKESDLIKEFGTEGLNIGLERVKNPRSSLFKNVNMSHKIEGIKYYPYSDKTSMSFLNEELKNRQRLDLKRSNENIPKL